ncbi:MAG: hypothetical protein ACP5QB_01730 [Thiomonas sp.]
MSSIKDKLTQSVRQARSAQPAKTTSPAPVRKSAAKPAAPATKAASATQPAAQQVPGAGTRRLAAEPTSSASTLFPQRVWPD